jgi:hypothetical protein
MSFKAIKTTFATVANFCRYVTLNSTYQLQMQENVKANSWYWNFDLEQMYHTLLWNFLHKNVPLSITIHNVQVVPVQAMKA